MLKTIRYSLEGLLAHCLFWIFKSMPVQMASGFGGGLARMIGPYLAVSRKADRHLARALPALTIPERRKALCGMWDNLGRVMAEYPHLKKIAQKYVTVYGIENLALQLPQPRVFIGGHLANWEVCSAVAALNFNIPIELTYRAPNNPWISRLLNSARSLNGQIKTHPKSAESGRALLSCLKEGRALGILIDQKYNEGVETLFFNQSAMTNPIFARLAQKYRAALYPIQIIRTQGCHFDLVIHPSISTHSAENQPRPIGDIMQDAQSLLEHWIAAHPAQWIWLHKRWKA